MDCRAILLLGAKLAWRCCRLINSITSHCPAADSIRAHGRFGRACIIQFPLLYINDMEFGADGVIWIASDGGLTRFDPAAPEAEMWFTYTPANSPLIHQ